MSLDLLVPGLLPEADAPASIRELRLPHAERWIARADVVNSPERDALSWLAGRYGLPAPAPVAAVTLAADEAPLGGTWLRADPVYARVERDAMVLHDGAILEIKRGEADALVAALQELFAADGLEFRAPRPDRWYVRVPEGEAPLTTPLDAALGRDVFRKLPRGAGRINWLSAITEAQMLLAAHPVNVARESRRQPPVNSVWFWGEGATPVVAARPYALTCARDPFARGLALLSGTRAVGLPGAFPAVDAVREDESALVVEDALAAALRRGDADAWIAAAQAADESWFATLDDALERFETVRIVLPSARHTCGATITAKARWRLLRPRRPLASHA